MQAGLFSASLTAFLVESYSNLTSDSQTGGSTVLLLTQISQQLAAIASNTTFTPQAIPSFQPSASAIICNALSPSTFGSSRPCGTLFEHAHRGCSTRKRCSGTPRSSDLSSNDSDNTLDRGSSSTFVFFRRDTPTDRGFDVQRQLLG